LTKLVYDEDKTNDEIDIYTKNGHGFHNGVDKDNVIILFSDFTIDSSGGDGSLEPDTTYVDWLWVLIETAKETIGKWMIGVTD
jgi:hypothetical protein